MYYRCLLWHMGKWFGQVLLAEGKLSNGPDFGILYSVNNNTPNTVNFLNIATYRLEFSALIGIQTAAL